jgi:hypothetical protein
VIHQNIRLGQAMRLFQLQTAKFCDVELASYFSYGSCVEHKSLSGLAARVPGLVTPMTAERRELSWSVDYVCRTEVTAVPATKTKSVCDILAHWVHRSYPIGCKRKENARVESAVPWRSIDFAEKATELLSD